MSMEDLKANKKKYGKTMGPIPCTRAFKRDMPFDHRAVDTVSFILINDVAQTRTHVNLYDGATGAGYDAEKSTYPLGDEKVQKKKLKGYSECAISECAVALPISPVSSPNVTTPPQEATGDSKSTS